MSNLREGHKGELKTVAMGTSLAGPCFGPASDLRRFVWNLLSARPPLGNAGSDDCPYSKYRTGVCVPT
jgi:hypothetical protein